MATTWERGKSHNGCQEWNGRGGEIVEASDPRGRGTVALACGGGDPSDPRGVREKGLIGLEEAVHQLTDVPARVYGLRERGRLAEGSDDARTPSTVVRAALGESASDEFTSMTSPPTGAYRSETAFTDSMTPKASPWARVVPDSGNSMKTMSPSCC